MNPPCKTLAPPLRWTTPATKPTQSRAGATQESSSRLCSCWFLGVGQCVQRLFEIVNASRSLARPQTLARSHRSIVPVVCEQELPRRLENRRPRHAHLEAHRGQRIHQDRIALTDRIRPCNRCTICVERVLLLPPLKHGIGYRCTLRIPVHLTGGEQVAHTCREFVHGIFVGDRLPPLPQHEQGSDFGWHVEDGCHHLIVAIVPSFSVSVVALLPMPVTLKSFASIPITTGTIKAMMLLALNSYCPLANPVASEDATPSTSPASVVFQFFIILLKVNPTCN